MASKAKGTRGLKAIILGSFLIDLDEAVARLAETGLLPQRGHTLTIIPIDAEGRPSGRVAVGSSELLRG